jgi:putative transposase
MREMAGVRISYGYRRLHVLLRREGWPINAKRVYRLYVEEGLGLKRKRPKRRRSAVARQERSGVAMPNERWAMDFMHDTLFDGRSVRVLTVIDMFTRECLALEVRRGFRGEDVAMVLSDLVARHGKPRTIQCDQGTEFTSMALDHWAYWNRVGLSFSRPGRPGDNARNEAFNGLVRRECLSQHYFLDLKEAAAVLESWKEEYNKVRPHGSLGQLTPACYVAGWTKTSDPERLVRCV